MLTHRQKRLAAAERHTRVIALRAAAVDQPWWPHVSPRFRASAFDAVRRGENPMVVSPGLREIADLALMGAPDSWIEAWMNGGRRRLGGLGPGEHRPRRAWLW